MFKRTPGGCGTVRDRIVLAVLIAAALSCSDTTGPEPLLPDRLRLSGEATGTDARGRTANCRLDITIVLDGRAQPRGGLIEYTGQHGGEVERSVLEPDQSGFAFFADVAGDAVVRLSLPPQAESPIGLEIAFPTNVNAEGRFWRELALLSGTLNAAHQGSGEWTCAPFDIYQEGYVDTAVVVHGTWQLKPAR